MAMRNFFFCKKHRETELKSQFLATDLWQNYPVKLKLFGLKRGQISSSPSKFQKLVRNSDGKKKFEKSELKMPFLPKFWRITGKWHRIWNGFEKRKIPKAEVERMAMKNFFCQKHRETELKSRFLATDLLQNWKKPRIMLKSLIFQQSWKKNVGQNFYSGSPGVLQNFKK